MRFLKWTVLVLAVVAVAWVGSAIFRADRPEQKSASIQPRPNEGYHPQKQPTRVGERTVESVENGAHQHIPIETQETPAEQQTADSQRRINCERVDGILKCGSCRTDYDCPEDAVCIVNSATGKYECRRSDCDSDGDCEPSQACIIVSAGEATDPVVKLCVAVGTQGIGQPCDPWPHNQRQACQRGLACSPRFTCEKPCDPKDPSTCEEEGTACILPTHAGMFCSYHCQEALCSGEKECIQLEGPISVCAKRIGDNCLETPCADGKICVRSPGYRRAEYRFECVSPCSSLASDCPSNYLCAFIPTTQGYGCFLECDPEDPYSCPDGLICNNSSQDAEHIWTCGFI